MTRQRPSRRRRPDAVILNVPVFAFPNLSVLAASLQTVPLLAIAPDERDAARASGDCRRPAIPSASSAGSATRSGGTSSEPDVTAKALRFLRAARAATRLRGQVFGLVGGRSIGMVNGAINPDVWMKRFGVDCDHVDQLDLIRRAEQVDESHDGVARWPG